MVDLVQLEINMKTEEEETINSSNENEELKPITTNTSPAENEEEVEDPYFHLRDGNYIGGLTMPS